MSDYTLMITTLSEGCFGSGEGLAQAIDLETAYERDTGLPVIPGKTVKGLLVEAADELVGSAPVGIVAGLRQAADRLFGHTGSNAPDSCTLRFGNAELPSAVREALKDKFKSQIPSSDTIRLTPEEVLESLTVIRRQTAIDEETGIPDEGSLRSQRLVIRETVFFCPLHFSSAPGDAELALLAAAAATVRRAGSGRNRGKGKLSMRLLDSSGADITDTHAGKYITKLAPSIEAV